MLNRQNPRKTLGTSRIQCQQSDNYSNLNGLDKFPRDLDKFQRDLEKSQRGLEKSQRDLQKSQRNLQKYQRDLQKGSVGS